MFSFLSKILQTQRIDCFSALPLSNCRILRPYLLERVGILQGTVFLLAVPYFTKSCLDPNRNISAYAVSRDYHLFFQYLFDRLIPALQERFPSNKFVGFADHSPIAEVEAAARAGLGVIGENGLLLTEKYSSYIFLGEIITDAVISCEIHEIRSCSACGACHHNCPSQNASVCLSALTQKKGHLTAEEQNKISSCGSAWGCDNCQEICPYTKAAIKSGTIFSPIPFFYESPIPVMTPNILAQLSPQEFSERAYSWRGKETIARNLQILEPKGEPTC